MKKAIPISIIVLSVVTFVIIFNIKVTTRVGVNYEWYTVKIPLGLKILNFLDRHYNYSELVKRIIKDASTDEEKALKIFEWVHKNIKEVPDGFAIIDDHTWYVIVRGYGASDQFSDVFAVLCDYAGINAYYSKVGANNKKIIFLTFVKIDKRWRVFDPFNGVYFKNSKGGFATIDNFKNKDFSIVSVSGKKVDLNYEEYLINLPDIQDAPLNRAKIQSPRNRLLFSVKKRLKLK